MRLRHLLVSAALATGAFAATAVPAQAGDLNAVCESGELCMYYHSTSYTASSFMDYYDENRTHHDDYFVSTGPGKGQIAGNNASSARCLGTRYDFAIFFNSDFKGQRHNHKCDNVRRDTPGWIQNNNASAYEPY